MTSEVFSSLDDAVVTPEVSLGLSCTRHPTPHGEVGHGIASRAPSSPEECAVPPLAFGQLANTGCIS